MSIPPAVSVVDLKKQYGSFTAVDGISFDIEAGETFALLGPNGAGKSTTVEILEGYRERTSGEVQVLGIDPRRGDLEWKARLGIVLQQTGESGNVTVREQLTHFAGLYPRPRSVDEVIAAVGLEKKASTRIKALSGGQRRRVDVALGVIGRPELLFLDEPTTGFDPEARRQFWELIRSLSREGTTIVLTTHYLDEAAQLSDRAAVIAGGTLIDMGPVDQLGSADARVPIVRWREQSGPPSGSGAAGSGAVREQRTTEPARFVADLVARSGEPAELEVIRPSLEDVYLGLVEAAERASGTVPTSGALEEARS
ncbi:ABC transporter ATP-binding protein [Herbiconiux sp. P18]|uniref:ABC transporter ATP-binding protein n=1 Tax=Herbiconiux liangxiaofengii TaxID=3342795 RepID=UPI0035B8C242